LVVLQHGKNINVDAWRLHQLAKATANQEHAWSRFFTGELQDSNKQAAASLWFPR
jgi:secreted Zn-dependent insulinase-like peptidase